LTVIFTGLQTFFKFDKLSIEHTQTSAKYGNLAHDLEEELVLKNRQPKQFLDETKHKMQTLAVSSLNVPDFLWNSFLWEVDSVLMTATSAQTPNSKLTEIKVEPRAPLAGTLREKLAEKRDRLKEYQLQRFAGWKLNEAPKPERPNPLTQTA